MFFVGKFSNNLIASIKKSIEIKLNYRLSKEKFNLLFQMFVWDGNVFVISSNFACSK